MPIDIIIPTLDHVTGASTGSLALLTAGCDARLLVVNGPQRGFTATVNDGLARARADADVCILNDDIHWFTHGWLEILRRALYSNARYGLACPTGKSRTAPMAKAHIGGTGIEPVNCIPFWCVLIRHAVLAQIGPLDSRYIHYASDNDYCDRAAAAGWQSIWVRDVYLEHQAHGSGFIHEWVKHDHEIYNRNRGHK